MTILHRFTVALSLGLLCASCDASRPPVQGNTEPAAPAAEKHFASEAEARASLDRYLETAVDVLELTDTQASNLECLYAYFCSSGGHEMARTYGLCDERLRRFDDAAGKAFGRHGEHGDVFGWVASGDDGTRASEEDKLARMHVIDDYTIESFERFWAAHEGNPIAIAIIRDYSAARWSSCCRAETTYFVWADEMEVAFEKAIERQPPWRRLTVGCNGDRDASRQRRGGEPQTSR
jgi:hypothetical protein